MGTGYILDTNVVSKYLDEEIPDWVLTLIDEILTEQPATMSTITKIELLVYKPIRPVVERRIKEFIDESEILGLSEPIILQTIRLRRQYKRVKLPDAIIAATAMVNDFTLLSTNDSDFTNITGLSYKSLNY